MDFPCTIRFIYLFSTPGIRRYCPRDELIKSPGHVICGCGFKLNPSPHCTLPCTTPKPTCQMEYRHKQFISAMLQTKSTAEEEACGGDLINSSLLPRFSHFHGLTFIFQSSRYLMMVQGSPVMWGIHYVRGGGANGRPVVLFSTRSPRKSFHRCYKQDECWNLFYVCRFIYYIAQSGTGTIGQLARILLPDSHSLNVWCFGMTTLLLFNGL